MRNDIVAGSGSIRSSGYPIQTPNKGLNKTTASLATSATDIKHIHLGFPLLLCFICTYLIFFFRTPSNCNGGLI